MARAALWGAIVTVVAAFPRAVICALTIGIPVPFAGWMHGVDWAVKSPKELMYHGVFYGGFPRLAVLGAFLGSIFYGLRRRSADTAQQQKPKDSFFFGWRVPLIIGFLVLGVIVLIACMMFGASLTWYGVSHSFL